MYYRSTRSDNKVTDTQAVLMGIAPDGGLYIDPDIASIDFDWRACLKKSALGMAEQILSTLLPSYDNMAELVSAAYTGKFETEDLTPLKSVGDKHVLELFRGPTSAFKDVALSMLPQLITAARGKEGVTDEIVILTATSGDTGKAALEGFKDVEGTKIIVFYPASGVSPVQKAQMVTQEGKNVRVCAVYGNFDDCQSAVKECFTSINASGELESLGISLSSANSINIGRLAPQLVYYFIAYAELCRSGKISEGDKVDYVVPTGNFGDILAGYYAKLLGLPVGKLVCASNANNILTDFLRSGEYDMRREFMRTSSPSMDILLSSNLERLLSLASGCDAELVCDCMAALKRDGHYTFDKAAFENIRANFSAYCCDDAQTEETIGKIWRENNYLCDTHTAVAFNAAEQYKASEWSGNEIVVLSTASPFKFPEAVLRAIGGDMSGDEFEQMETLSSLTGVPIPKNLAGLREREVRHLDEVDRAKIKEYVLSKLRDKENF